MLAAGPRNSQLPVVVPARTLIESAPLLQQRELPFGSPLYADLGPARDTDELTELVVFLKNAATVPHAYAKAAFVGNRGSGKSQG